MADIDGKIRCKKCGKVLGEFWITNGKWSIVCPRCKVFNSYSEPQDVVGDATNSQYVAVQ